MQKETQMPAVYFIWCDRNNAHERKCIHLAIVGTSSVFCLRALSGWFKPSALCDVGLHQTPSTTVERDKLVSKFVYESTHFPLEPSSHRSVASPSWVLGTFSSAIASVSLSHTHTVCDVRPLCSNSPCVINPCNYIVVFFPKALIKLCNVLDLPTLRKRKKKSQAVRVHTRV